MSAEVQPRHFLQLPSAQMTHCIVICLPNSKLFTLISLPATPLSLANRTHILEARSRCEVRIGSAQEILLLDELAQLECRLLHVALSDRHARTLYLISGSGQINLFLMYMKHGSDRSKVRLILAMAGGLVVPCGTVEKSLRTGRFRDDAIQVRDNGTLLIPVISMP